MTVPQQPGAGLDLAAVLRRADRSDQAIRFGGGIAPIQDSAADIRPLVAEVERLTAASANLIRNANADVTEARYLIWSNHHGLWWRANGAGYTSDAREAGRYTLDDAERRAIGRTWAEGEPPPEVIVLCPPDSLIGAPGGEATLHSMVRQIAEYVMAHRHDEDDASQPGDLIHPTY